MLLECQDEGTVANRDRYLSNCQEKCAQGGCEFSEIAEERSKGVHWDKSALTEKTKNPLIAPLAKLADREDSAVECNCIGGEHALAALTLRTTCVKIG